MSSLFNFGSFGSCPDGSNPDVLGVCGGTAGTALGGATGATPAGTSSSSGSDLSSLASFFSGATSFIGSLSRVLPGVTSSKVAPNNLPQAGSTVTKPSAISGINFGEIFLLGLLAIGVAFGIKRLRK